MEVAMSVGTMLARQEVFGNMENTLTLPRRVHQCVTCSKSFSAPSKLRRHILSHTGQKPFGCHFCEKSYRQLAHLKLHINTHFNPRPVPQRKTNMGSDSVVTSVEKVPPEPAETSVQSNPSDGLSAEGTSSGKGSISLTAHYDRVAESSLCSSYICEPDPSIGPALHPEMESYDGTPPSQEEQISGQDSSEPCKEVISEDTSVPDATADKRRDGVAGKPNSSSRTVHQCPECFKCFSAPSKLKRHCLIHTGQRPFQCSICGSAFRQLSHLKAHSSIHSLFAKRSNPPPQPKLKSFSQHQRPQTWHRNYVCSTCGRRYRQMRHLIVHQLTHKVPEVSAQLGKLNHPSVAYPAPRMYSAPPVPLDSLNLGSSVTLSEKRHVGDQAVGRDPPVTSSTSPKQHNTTKDVDIMEHGDNTGSSDLNVAKSKKSFLAKNVKRNQCMVCQKTFEYPSKLSRHLLVHMGIKPFKCQVCRKSFRQRCHLQNHQHIHKLKTCLGVVPKQEQSGDQRSNQQSDLASEPSLKTDKDFKGLDSFPSQYGAPIKHYMGQCSSESSYTPVAQPSAWDHSGNMLPGVDCGAAVDKHVSGELLPSGLGQRSVYGNTSQVSEAMPAHGGPKPKKLVSLNKPSVAFRGHGYCCPVCSKHFSAPSKLRRHSLTHVGQRSYQCPVCLKTFRQNAHLKTHMAFHDQGTETELSVMDRKTEPLSGPEEYQSSIDSDPVTSQPEDTQTDPVSQPEAPNCSNEGDTLCNHSEVLSSPNEDNIPSTVPPASTGHTTTTGSDRSAKPSTQRKLRGYQCALCSKTFDFPSKLSRHLLVHMGIKPFRCQICSKSFRQLCHLQNHLKIHNRASSWDEGQHREAGSSMLAQQDLSPSSDNNMSTQQQNLSPSSKPERHPDFTTATPHQDRTVAAGQTSEDQQRNDQYEQNGDESSYSRFCSTGRSHLENLNMSFDYETTSAPKLENVSHIKSECSGTLSQTCSSSFACISPSKQEKSAWDPTCISPSKQEKSAWDPTCISPSKQEKSSWDPTCISPSKQEKSAWDPTCISPSREKSAWGVPEEKHMEISPDEYHKQGNHIQFQNQYFRHPETDNGEQAPHVDGHNQTVSQDMTNDPDHRLYLYQSTMTPPYCHSEYGVKEERSEVQLRSEVNLAYVSEPPKDLHVCPGCAECFTTRRKLSQHRCALKPAQKERHSSSYQCAICYKSFEAPSKLKRHYLIHTGQRPFQCTVCEKAFTQSGHLKTHLLTHK